MVERSNVKITVMKKLRTKALWENAVPESFADDVCPRFRVGDVYVKEGLSMPKD